MIRAVVSKTFRFEAAHVLPRHPGKCSRLHGHSWVLTVAVEGPVDEETGFVVDYADLSALVNHEIVDRLDHTHLGQGYCSYGHTSPPDVGKTLMIQNYATQVPFGENFYPSSENLTIAIGKMLQPLVKELRHGVRLFEVTLDETCTSRCVWRPEPEREPITLRATD